MSRYPVWPFDPGFFEVNAGRFGSPVFQFAKFSQVRGR